MNNNLNTWDFRIDSDNLTNLVLIGKKTATTLKVMLKVNIVLKI